MYSYAAQNPVKFVDADGNVFFIPIIIFVAKELAGEAFEQTTGIPAPTIKNLGKHAIKTIAKEGAQHSDDFAKSVLKQNVKAGKRGESVATEGFAKRVR